jgi:hypothetical protein
MFISTKYGLGQSFSTVTLEQHWGMETVLTYNPRIDHELTHSQAYLIAQITLYISLGLSKLDWFLLLHTIFLTGPNTRPVLTRITTGLIVISTILSVLSVSIECLHRGLSPEKPSETCSGIPTRYLVVFILDITTDLFLVLLPSYLIMPVQMKRKKKLKFAGIFALRLTLVAPATMSFVFWQDTLHSRNLETVRANALAIQAAQLWFSIILCMATRLIKLIRCFNTYSGMGPGFPEPSDQGGCELDTATSTRNGSSSMPEIVWESGLQRCTQEKDSESQKSTAALCKPQRCA